jgi:hypothetical protein
VDQSCVCGHGLRWHYSGKGGNTNCGTEGCRCLAFDPTPAPTAPLTAEHLATARAQAESALAGCAFCGSSHTGQAMHKPVPYVLEVPASEMLELLDHIDAIARHREQTDAEVARLVAAVEAVLADLHGLSEMVHPDPAHPGIGVRMVSIAAVRIRIRAALATRPHAPSLPAGAPGYEEIEG